jgi:hypothetical protein
MINVLECNLTETCPGSFAYKQLWTIHPPIWHCCQQNHSKSKTKWAYGALKLVDTRWYFWDRRNWNLYPSRDFGDQQFLKTTSQYWLLARLIKWNHNNTSRLYLPADSPLAFRHNCFVLNFQILDEVLTCATYIYAFQVGSLWFLLFKELKCSMTWDYINLSENLYMGLMLVHNTMSIVCPICWATTLRSPE